MIREITENDLSGLLELYLHLHEVSIPTIDEHVVNTWRRIHNCAQYDEERYSLCIWLKIKMMLMTGSSNPDTHAFYKKAGYKADGKTAYVRMLKEVNWRI